MSSFGISETAANPSAVRKGGTTHDLFSEDEVAFRVYIELGNLLVLKAIRARPEANKAIEKMDAILGSKRNDRPILIKDFVNIFLIGD